MIGKSKKREIPKQLFGYIAYSHVTKRWKAFPTRDQARFLVSHVRAQGEDCQYGKVVVIPVRKGRKQQN